MYVTSIIFKRAKDSKWEYGYYIGETDNSENSTLLDCNFKPIVTNYENNAPWDWNSSLMEDGRLVQISF